MRVEGYAVGKAGGQVTVALHGDDLPGNSAVKATLSPQMARDIGALLVAYGLQLGAKEPISQAECESRPPPQPSW